MAKRSTTRRLVVFYSLEGTTRAIAQAIAGAVGAEVVELRLEKPMVTDWRKYLVGGFGALFGLTPKLKPTKEIGDYELVFIGTPIWASRCTPAVRSFVHSAKLQGKHVALFCTCQDNGKAAFSELRRRLRDSSVEGEMQFAKVLKDKAASIKRAREWANQMVAGVRKTAS